QAALAVLVELVEAGLEVVDQGIAIARAGLAGAQAVELQGHRVGHTEALPEARSQSDQLGIDVRTGEIEDFYADLVELPVAALLRLLVAEHRAGVPELLHLAATAQTVLEHRAYAAGGAFRTQGQGLVVAVGEGVHAL